MFFISSFAIDWALFESALMSGTVQGVCYALPIVGQTFGPGQPLHRSATGRRRELSSVRKDKQKSVIRGFQRPVIGLPNAPSYPVSEPLKIFFKVGLSNIYRSSAPPSNRRR